MANLLIHSKLFVVNLGTVNNFLTCLLGGGAHLMVLRTYSWFCDYESLQVVIKRSYVLPHKNTGWLQLGCLTPLYYLSDPYGVKSFCNTDFQHYCAHPCAIQRHLYFSIFSSNVVPAILLSPSPQSPPAFSCSSTWRLLISVPAFVILYRPLNCFGSCLNCSSIEGWVSVKKSNC